MQKLNKILTFIRRQPRWRQITAGVLLALGAWWALRSGTSAGPAAPTFAARRGPLEINVLEGGSLQALESQEAKCEVRVGYQGTKILRIVEEGYLVSDADVTNGKVLVELDSSDLQKQIAQQELQYQEAVATLIDAQQNYEIQLNQNQSDIKAAEQKARFARMDFDKFLGDTVSAQIIKEHGLDKIFAEASSYDAEQTGHAEVASTVKDAPPPSITESGTVPPGRGATNGSAPGVVAGPGRPAVPSVPAAVTNLTVANAIPDAIIDFLKYASLEALGDGEAKQKLRKFEDDLQAAQKDLGQARATLEGTKRLYEKQFVAKYELTRDQLLQDSAELKVQTAETDRALFLKYDFSKTAEKSLSDYTDAVRELDRARRAAISKLAQAKAKLQSAQGQYEVQTRQRQDLKEQLEKCTIRAQKSGLVVYGGSGDNNYYGGQEPIREGATVRERQAIFTIPDMSRMSVSVKIHESYIKKITKGQKARITVDAFPDTILTGDITKVGVLPDSQNRWMNPDLKVYNTTITINGSYDWVKPGMSAKVEILVNKLADVVYIPLQAVVPGDGRQFCYVAGHFKPERREITVGDFNDDFIEIKRGLQEGERVLLRPPDGAEADGAEKNKTTPEPKPTEPAKASPPALPAKATPATSKA